MTRSDSTRFSGKTFMDCLLEPGGFSFLRMGDGELRFLLECQEGTRDDSSYSAKTASGLSTFVKGAASNRVGDYDKIRWSYETCSVVDWYTNQEYNRDHLSDLKINRPDNPNDIRDEKISGFLLPWTYHHLKALLEQRRCLFCSAEAPIQGALLRQPEYLEIAGSVWGDGGNAHFMALPDNGMNLSQRYPEILELLIKEIQEKEIDVLYLGASGLAKPLCVEIANRCSIKALDMGSLMRATSYSATSGPYPWRANHNPFYFRIPLAVHYKAVRETYPELDEETLALKATAQLCLDLCRKVKLSHHNPSDLHDPGVIDTSQPNWDAFLTNYAYYRKHLLPELTRTEGGRAKANEFKTWLKIHGIFRRYRILNTIKRALKALIGKKY